MQNPYIPKNRDELFFLGNLHIASRALHILAQYPIADYLEARPKSLDEIALHFQFDAKALQKLLRILAFFGVVQEEAQGRFSLTKTGKFLSHSHPESLKDLLFWDETRWTPFGKLEETLKTGLPAFPLYYGEGYFDYLSKKPALAELFDQHMRAVSFQENQVLGSLIPLDDVTQVIDLGGGEGGLVEAILNENPHLKAVLLDLPQTIDAVESSIQSQYPGRASCVRGSFFDPLQGSFDAAIFKRVLHDWSDEKCLDILAHAKKGIRPGGKIFIIETVMQGPKDSPLDLLVDLFLFTVFGGQERSLADYQELLKKAGLTFAQLIETRSSMSIIVAHLPN